MIFKLVAELICHYWFHENRTSQIGYIMRNIKFDRLDLIHKLNKFKAFLSIILIIYRFRKCRNQNVRTTEPLGN